MSINRRNVYDQIHYWLEFFYAALYHNARTRKAIKGKSFDKAFYQAYAETIRPYWRKYGVRVRKLWYKSFYASVGSTDPRYIPNTLFYRFIIPHFNDPLFLRPLADKNLHSHLVPGIKRPETIFKYMDGAYRQDDLRRIPEEEALGLLEKAGAFVLKPTRDTSEGNNVQIFDAGMDMAALKKALEPYQQGDYIVQKPVTQHPDFARLNPTSLNTLRVVTFVFRGEVHILSTILRVGSRHSKVDNVAKGGYQCTVLPNGTLAKTAYHPTNSGADPYVEQTEDGLRFEGFVVPSFDKVCETAKKYAMCMPHLSLLGWDLAVDENSDVVLIEYNCQPGQNQTTCGPTFGELTDEVLAEVFHRANRD